MKTRIIKVGEKYQIQQHYWIQGWVTCLNLAESPFEYDSLEKAEAAIIKAKSENEFTVVKEM